MSCGPLHDARVALFGACGDCDRITSQPEVISEEQYQQELEELHALEEATLKELAQLRADECQLDFRSFVEEFFEIATGRPLKPNRATDAVCAMLQKVAEGEELRVAIAMPPGVAKTTYLNCYVAWRLTRDASYRCIYMCHASELSAISSRRTRRIVESDKYQQMFPYVRLRDDENTITNWATSAGGQFMCAGLDSNITGKRADEMIVDDPMNAIDRFSSAKREAVWDWWTSNGLTRLNGTRPAAIVVHQRLEKDDLIGRLVMQGGWVLLELPAEFEDGTLLAPEILPRERLDDLKAQSLSVYNCQYLQRPSDDSDALIKRSMWRFYHNPGIDPKTPRPGGCDTNVPAVPIPQKFDRVVISVDMTFGGTDARHDFAVVQAWGARGADRFLLEQWRKRATQLEQRMVMREFAKRYPHAKILLEKAAGGQGAEEILSRDGVPNIILVGTGGKNKETRIGLVSPTIESGHCLLPLGAPWLGDFVEELAGATKHDDQQDAVAYALADLNVANTQRHANAAASLQALVKRYG